jgi:hypothetical protein
MAHKALEHQVNPWEARAKQHKKADEEIDVGDCGQRHPQNAQAQPCDRKEERLQRMVTDEFGFTAFPKENEQRRQATEATNGSCVA